MTLKELRAAFLYDTAFDLDGFTERVTYWPLRGASRELSANPVFNRPAEDRQTSQGVLVSIEQVAFDVGNNPDHEEHGGIERPSRGDGIGLASEPSTLRWGVRAVEQICGGWRLHCDRESLVSIGAQVRT